MTRYQLILIVLAPLLIFTLFSVSSQATTQQNDILVYANNNWEIWAQWQSGQSVVCTNG